MHSRRFLKETVLLGKSEMGQGGRRGGQEGLRQDLGPLPVRPEDPEEFDQAKERHSPLPLLAAAPTKYATTREIKETLRLTAI